MNKLIFYLFFFLTFLSYAQNADEIVTKNLENTGGLKNWKKLNSVKLTGTVNLNLGESFPIEIIQKKENLTKTTFTINNKKQIIEGFDGKKAYQMNFSTNKVETLTSYQAEPFESDLINYKEKGFTIKYVGQEKIENKNCYKIQLKKDDKSLFYYFNIKNLQLEKEENKNEIIIYSDYKNVGGYQFAFRIESINKKDNSSFVIELNKIEINSKLTIKDFKR